MKALAVKPWGWSSSYRETDRRTVLLVSDILPASVHGVLASGQVARRQRRVSALPVGVNEVFQADSARYYPIPDSVGVNWPVSIVSPVVLDVRVKRIVSRC